MSAILKYFNSYLGLGRLVDDTAFVQPAENWAEINPFLLLGEILGFVSDFVSGSDTASSALPLSGSSAAAAVEEAVATYLGLES